MAIELQNITKSYQEGGKRQTILSSASASFPSGRFSVILGKSGSGKSTVLNLIGGIDQPDSGKILIENNELTGLTDLERTLFRRRHIGFVFQFFNLIPTLTVLENTMLILELEGSVKNKQRAIAGDILREVGLGDRLQARPDRLSGGEQQRVAIARALAHDPALILADEPTGNLDHETGSTVLNLLASITRDRRKTLIMATHSEEALAAADHVYRIENGMLRPVDHNVNGGQ